MSCAWPLLVLSVVSVGCTTIGLREPLPIEREVIGHQRVDKTFRTPDSTASVDGTVLKVRTFKNCAKYVQDMNLVQTGESREHFNATPANDWYAVTAAAIFGLGGTYALMSANSMKREAGPGGLSLASKPAWEEMVIASASNYAVGAAFLIAAIVDVARAQGSDETYVTKREPGAWLSGPIACSDVPVVGAEISVRILGGTANVGRTDARGELSVDLRGVLSGNPDINGRLEPTMRVYQGSETIAELQAPELVAYLDDQTWEAAEADSCQVHPNPNSCKAVRAYQIRFPLGLHHVDATHLTAVVAAIADEEVRRIDVERSRAEVERQLAMASLERAAIAKQQREAEREAAAVRAEQKELGRRSRHLKCRRDCERACGSLSGCLGKCTATSCGPG